MPAVWSEPWRNTSFEQRIGQLIEALNALELDARVPESLPARRLRGEARTAFDYGRIAEIAVGNLELEAPPDFEIKAGLPAGARGLSPGWPVVHYDVDWSGRATADSYVDVSIHVGGIDHMSSPATLRAYQRMRDGYRDVTLSVDAMRRVVMLRSEH